MALGLPRSECLQVIFKQLHRQCVVSRSVPTIALDAADQPLAVVVDLDQRTMAVGAVRHPTKQAENRNLLANLNAPLIFNEIIIISLLAAQESSLASPRPAKRMRYGRKRMNACSGTFRSKQLNTPGKMGANKNIKKNERGRDQ